jgi:hypothetical protein
LVNSGLATQSVEALRPRFSRWARYLRDQGIKEIPTSPWAPDSDPHAMNLMNMFVKQVTLVKDSSGAHELRNLTQVRPYKL